MLLDEGVKLSELRVLLILGTLSHQDLQDLLEPFSDLSPLQIFAERLQKTKINSLIFFSG